MSAPEVRPSGEISTIYNGSAPCMRCGQAQTPTAAMFGPVCYRCKTLEQVQIKNNRMVGRY